MPTIPPRVPTQTQQPTPMPYQRSNAPALAFGAGGQGLSDLGQGMMHGAAALDRIAQKMQEEDDLDAVKKAGTALSDDLRMMMFGADGAGGFYTQRGKSAVDGLTSLRIGIDDAIEQRSAALANENQRRMFSSFAAGRRTSELDGATRYAAGQRLKGLDDTSEAVIQSAIADGALRFNVDGDRNTAYNTGAREVLGIGQRNGWSPEIVQVKMREYASNFWAAAIGRAAEADPPEAKKMFDQNKERLLPEQLAKSEALVDQKTKLMRVDAAVQRAKTVGAATEGSADNNPGNLMPGGTIARFATPADGVAATIRNLQSYPDRFGASTLNQIAARWAPAGHGDNDPAIWARNVGQFSGIDPDAPLDLRDTEVLKRILPAIARQEKGVAGAGIFTPSAIALGIEKAVGNAPIAEAAPSRADIYVQQRDAIEQDKSLDLAERDAALARLAHDKAVEDQIQSQREKDARAQIAGMVLTQKLDPMAAPPELQILAGPEYMERMKNAYGKDGAVPFSPAVEDSLHNLALHDPERFLSTDLSVFYGKHKTERVEYWQAQQRQMASAENRASLRAPSYALGDSIIKSIFPVSRGDKDRAESNPDDMTNSFVRASYAQSLMRSWIDAYHSENKKAPPSEEAYRYARSLTLSQERFQTLSPDTWGGGIFVFSSPESRLDALRSGRAGSFALSVTKDTMPDIAQATGIPAETLPQVVDYLKARKLPVTYEALIRAYEAGTRGGNNG